MSAHLAAPYAIVDAGNPPRLDDVRRLFRDYAEWIGVDLGFQDFEQELATLPGKYAPPAGRLLLLVRGEEAVGCIALRRFDKTSGEVKSWGGAVHSIPFEHERSTTALLAKIRGG